MPRDNKKTRIKGLPPKLQMQQKDASTGSYPSKSRLASDNRTGDYNINWNDNKTIIFGQNFSFATNLQSYFRFQDPTDRADGGATGHYFPTFANINEVQKTDVAMVFNQAGNDWLTENVPVEPDIYGDELSILYVGNISSNCSGTISVFNPGVETATQSEPEKSWTTSFILRGLNAEGAINSLEGLWRVGEQTVATPAAQTDPFDGNIAYFAHRNADGLDEWKPRFVLLDQSGNGFGVEFGYSYFGFDNDWCHYTLTYDGSKTFNGIKLYMSGTEITSRSNIEYRSGQSAYIGITSSIEEHRFQLGHVDWETVGTDTGPSTNETWNIADLAIFNKALSAEEVSEFFNYTFVDVARTLAEGFAGNGIYSPSLVPSRSINPLAKEELKSGFIFGTGINYTSPHIEYIEEQSTNLVGDGFVRKGVGDSIAHFSPGQDLTPFRDFENPAVDGKSVANPFYATGSLVSDVGEGFDQPLWSKSKIEIDISAVEPKTIGYRSGSNVGGDDFAMMYYNAGTQTYMPVGSRKRWDEYEDASGSQFQNFINEKAIGFLPAVSIVAAGTTIFYYHQTPTSVFGFPYDEKYFINSNDSASSSILIPVSNWIDEPFLVEKIVVSFSCSHFAPHWETNAGAGLGSHAINTFFILNQKKNGKTQTTLKMSGSDFPLTQPNLEFTSSVEHRSGAMDLVTFNQFMFVGDTLAHATGAFPDSAYLEAQLQKEIQPFYVKDLYPGNEQFKFTGSINLSGTIKTPTATMPNIYSTLTELPFTYTTVEVPSGNNSDGFVRIQNTGFTGGRNGLLTIPNTRNLTRNFEAISERSIQLESGPNGQVPEIFARVPYILQPGDQLIIGWQCAYPITEHSTIRNPFPFAASPFYTGPELTINAGPAKVTLYGSKIRNGEETHDTLNQLLTSNSVHEVIE